MLQVSDLRMSLSDNVWGHPYSLPVLGGEGTFCYNFTDVS